MMAEIRG
jgi:hypothetical protein